MDLVKLLDQRREDILTEATASLAHARQSHYAGSASANRDRLARLYDLTVTAVRDRNLTPMLEFAQQLARDRHQDGFDLQEVQTAFNVLEEAIWKAITKGLKGKDYPQAFGLTSTALGAGKAALAREYVSLASQTRVPTLDLTELFQSTY
jgi:hypothetical protein